MSVVENCCILTCFDRDSLSKTGVVITVALNYCSVLHQIALFVGGGF